MRFYGLSPKEIDEFSLEDYWMCAEAMERIEASERLMGMQQASSPHLSNKDRKKIVRKLERISDPDSYEERQLTHEDMEALLNG